MRVRTGMVAGFALLAALSTASHAQSVDRSGMMTPVPDGEYAPPIDLWLDRVSLNFGERIRPFVVSEEGAYVTVIRVTSDGEIRVLYPRRPGDQKPFSRAELVNDRIPFTNDQSFHLYESTGTGFVFAIASYDRFNYREYSHGGLWNVARLAMSRYGDPFAIVNRFISRTLADQSDFSIDYVSYEVYSGRASSGYASRYSSYGWADYYEDCLGAFGIRYTNSCRSYHGRDRYFGVIVRPAPRQPARPVPGKTMRLKPLVPDPLSPGAPATVPAQGIAVLRFPADASLKQPDRSPREIRRFDPERLSVRTNPRVEASGARSSEPGSEPRSDPRASARVEPRREAHPQMRRDPQPQTRGEPRPQTRSEPQAQIRSEPRPQTRSEPQPLRRSDTPRPAPQPHQKDQN